MNICDFKKMYSNNTKISVITCYDYWSAKIIAQTNIDAILVGDSLAMVMHGYPNTLAATADLMTLHIEAVAKGAANKFIIGDMPFLSYRKDITSTMHVVEKFMRAGANAIKLEGADGNFTTIEHIVSSGVPVMGHIGLTAQALNQLGGFKIQGKNNDDAAKLLAAAKNLAAAGCFALVLECIPAMLAQQITASINIPTIGIGAGPNVSGQVLVLQDLLGMNQNFKPKFLKTYCAGSSLILEALNSYHKEVKEQIFPGVEHTY